MQAPLQAKNDSDAVQMKTARMASQQRTLVDNHSTALAQRKLAEMMNNSPCVSQQRALSDAINNSPRMVAQRHKMNAFFGGAVRQQGDGAMSAELSPAQREEKINNTGLPDQLKSGIESLSGMSMDHVKVHYNSDKPSQLQAHAYAQGSEIHVAPGQERHLPHEAWHVVQQAQGRVKPTVMMKGVVPIDDSQGLEAEADLMGAKAIQIMSEVGNPGREMVKMSSPPAQFAAVAQLVRIRELLAEADDAESVIARLRKLIVHWPSADEAEQEEFKNAITKAAGFWDHVDAKEIGNDDNERRTGLIAALMEADATNGLQRLIRYYFGQGERPRDDGGRGLGTLGFSRNERGGIAGIEGRPGLFAINTGGASQARRHIIAWHTVRNVMNHIIAGFGAHDLAEISRRIVEVVDPDIGVQATQIAQRAIGKDGLEFRILWLAIVLNNVPHNLWLGAARENISINTLAGNIRALAGKLIARQLSLVEFAERIQNYNAGSPMARRAIHALLQEIQSAVTQEGADAYLIVNEFVRRTILPQLEIDPRREYDISPLARFLYEAGEGMLVISDVSLLQEALARFVEG